MADDHIDPVFEALLERLFEATRELFNEGYEAESASRQRCHGIRMGSRDREAGAATRAALSYSERPCRRTIDSGGRTALGVPLSSWALGPQH